MSLRLIGLPLLLFLAACATTPANLPVSNTPDPIQAYVNANASKATEVAAIATADYFSTQLTATVDARNQIATQQVLNMQATQQAVSILSTQRAWDATSTADTIQSTTMASGTATAGAAQAIWTQRAVDITSTADVASVQAYATQEYAAAKSNELSLQRQELMNNVAAVTPWAAFGVAFLVAILLVLRWSRVRVIQRAPNGDAPLLLDVVDSVAYDADRHPTSTAGLTRQDLKRLPQFSPAEHLQITAQDQLLDMTSRGTDTGHELNRKTSMAQAMLQPGNHPQIQILETNQARPLFQDVLPRLVQDAIEAEVIFNEPEGETKDE